MIGFIVVLTLFVASLLVFAVGFVVFTVLVYGHSKKAWPFTLKKWDLKQSSQPFTDEEIDRAYALLQKRWGEEFGMTEKEFRKRTSGRRVIWVRAAGKRNFVDEWGRSVAGITTPSRVSTVAYIAGDRYSQTADLHELVHLLLNDHGDSHHKAWTLDVRRVLKEVKLELDATR